MPAGAGWVKGGSSVADALNRGQQSEERVLNALGETKNTTTVTSADGTKTIPDFINTKQVAEIKDTKRVSNTAQIKAQREHAAATGKEKKDDILKHKGHDLKDGSKGDPHFQTEGVKGHTFWGGQSGAFSIGMLAETLILPILATPSTLAMMDEMFSKMSQEKLNDWGVALLGVSGIPNTSERLGVSAVKEFANAELEQLAMDDPALDLVVELATEEPSSSADMRDRLARLCDIKNVDLEQSKRKWQLFSLHDLLQTLDPDTVYGMIALSEFWSAWDCPADSPASIRTDVGPAEYHSDAHYLRVVDDHRQWLAQHMASLRGS